MSDKRTEIKTAKDFNRYMEGEIKKINANNDVIQNHWSRFKDEFSSITTKTLREIQSSTSHETQSQIKEIIDRCITTLIEEHDRKINNIYKISGLISVILTAIATIYTAFFK